LFSNHAAAAAGFLSLLGYSYFDLLMAIEMAELSSRCISSIKYRIVTCFFNKVKDSNHRKYYNIINIDFLCTSCTFIVVQVLIVSIYFTSLK
jgi:hypothetical protein